MFLLLSQTPHCFITMRSFCLWFYAIDRRNDGTLCLLAFVLPCLLLFNRFIFLFRVLFLFRVNDEGEGGEVFRRGMLVFFISGYFYTDHIQPVGADRERGIAIGICSRFIG